MCLYIRPEGVCISKINCTQFQLSILDQTNNMNNYVNEIVLLNPTQIFEIP
jgi:hypothetical protein